MVYIILKYVPSRTLSGEPLIINRCWILSKAFSASIEMIIWFLFFNLWWCITAIDLQILKNPCIPRINPTWSQCMILLMYCWIWIASILLRTDEWIKKMCYIYTMGYYSAIKKNEIMPFAATWMDLEIIILSEISHTEKDKYLLKNLKQ